MIFMMILIYLGIFFIIIIFELLMILIKKDLVGRFIEFF